MSYLDFRLSCRKVRVFFVSFIAILDREGKATGNLICECHHYGIPLFKIIMMLDKDRILLLDRITVNPQTLTGKPTIRNTRLSVEHLLKAFAAGLSFESLLEDYPFLEFADIQACLLYAAELVESEKVYSAAEGKRNNPEN